MAEYIWIDGLNGVRSKTKVCQPPVLHRCPARKSCPEEFSLRLSAGDNGFAVALILHPDEPHNSTCQASDSLSLNHGHISRRIFAKNS